MSDPLDTNVNDMVNRLRQSVATTSTEHSSNDTAPEQASATNDQILEQLKAHLGAFPEEVEAPSSDSDYDIRGFEITEEEAAESDITEDESIEDEIVEDEIETACESEATMTQEQETVRRQVEMFVEKTLSSDEEFDYFAHLDEQMGKRENAKALADPEELLIASVPLDTDAVEVVVAPSADDELDSCPHIPETDDREDDEAEHADSCAIASPEIYTLASNFFFRKADIPSDTVGGISSTQAASALDDTDINLLLALGQKQPLEDSIGFVRVREAKNNFYDPTNEEPIGRAYAYEGEEFCSNTQIDDIKQGYQKERKKTTIGFVSTLLLALSLLFVQYIEPMVGNIPSVSDWLSRPYTGALVSFVLMAVGLAISFKPLLYGLRGFVAMRPNQHTPMAVLCFVNLLYNVTMITLWRDKGLSDLNFAVLVFLVMMTLGDKMRLTREIMTFDVISDDKEKFSLEKASATADSYRESDLTDAKELLVEKVDFVGKYFSRTSRRPEVYSHYFVELLIATMISVAIGILTAYLQKDIVLAIEAFVFGLMVCVPVHYLIHGIYPLKRLTKLLYRNSSAMIGQSMDSEYVGARTIYLDDIEMFGLDGVAVSGLRLYNDCDFCQILYLASAVFSRIEGPLRYVFQNSSQEIKPPKSVKLENIYPMGIEALVDGEETVLVGNMNFMRSNGLFPKRNDEDEKKTESGELSILYMAVNGILQAKFYMKYTVLPRFEKFVSEMNQNNTNVGIRTLDPNITERMLALLRKDPDTTIAVVRPTLNDLVPLGRRSDSSIITTKNPHMVAKMLALCIRLKSIRRFNTWFRIVSMLLAGAGAVGVAFWMPFSQIPSIYPALYQLLWLIPTLLYSKITLKSGKNHENQK